MHFTFMDFIFRHHKLEFSFSRNLRASNMEYHFVCCKITIFFLNIIFSTQHNRKFSLDNYSFVFIPKLGPLRIFYMSIFLSFSFTRLERINICLIYKGSRDRSSFSWMSVLLFFLSFGCSRSSCLNDKASLDC